jgi:hypothetical protein
VIDLENAGNLCRAEQAVSVAEKDDVHEATIAIRGSSSGQWNAAPT